MPDLRQAGRGARSGRSARKRCADVDLNRWLSGVYAVPGRKTEDEDGRRAERPDEAATEAIALARSRSGQPEIEPL